MLKTRVLLSSALTLFAVLGPARSLPTPGCQSGPGKGTWELPSGGGSSDGYVAGLLYLAPTNAPRYSFSAGLTDQPTPCLSCVAGTIDGFLDDGFGPAPDYLVKGTYFGTWISGSGSFHADVYPLGSTTPVGKIDGTFADPPGSTVPGTFKANWEICP